MPFNSDFDAVFEDLIQPTLLETGFSVTRADKITNQQAVMNDVVQSLANSDLIIVADLTGGNPNVCYELGIAHALNKPVILLAQDLDALLFDLSPYRVIPYTMHLRDARRARITLRKIATGFLDGSARFW